MPEVELESSSVYQAAETEAEKILVKIWSDVLKNDQIGVHDNFFELGGDSILSIQIISRASDSGLMLQPRDVFEYQTIAQLAQYAEGQENAIETEQGILEGEVDLIPIQHWFFEQEFIKADQWNQSVLLTINEKFDAKLLDIGFRFGVIFQFQLRQLGVTIDTTQDIVEIVGNATGEVPDRLHALRLLHAVYQLFAIGDIYVGAQHPDRVAGCIRFNHFTAGQDPAPLIVFGPHAKFQLERLA